MALLKALQDLLQPEIKRMSALGNNSVTPVQAGVLQDRPMQTLPNIGRAPYEQQNGFEPMQPGGARFVTEDNATFYDGQGFSPKPEEPWYKRMTDDPAFIDRLAMGFNTMRLNPDQGLQAVLADRIKTAGELAKGNKTAEAVIVQLRNMGENEAADMVAAQPAIAKDVLKQIVQAKYAKSASPTASGVQIDPNTGQMYQVVFNPSTGKNERVNVEGATGETPSQKAARDSAERLKVFGMEKAAVAGQEIYKRASSLNESITLLSRAKEVVTKGGAQSGIIRSMLPAFDSATAELNEIASRLGINIINSATFGALSEKELGLALSTGLDRSLSGDELVKHIRDKISAQEKLYNQLMSDARLLTGGMTMNEYIQLRTSEPRKTPFPVYGGGVQLPPDLRSQMNEDEVAAFNKLPTDMQQKFINGQ
jgi:hypothetical protein